MDYNKIGMFTTKRFHKWEGTSFLNNHKEQNEYKDPNSGLPNRWKNKQFETQFPKIGHDSFFRRITYASDPYPGHKSRDAIDSMRIENGFGTSSNRANGNFMNVAGQGAWKQRIRKERNAIRRYGSKFPRSTSTLKAQGQALGKIQRQPGGTIGINLQTFKNSSRPATTTPQRRLYDIYHDVNFEPKTYHRPRSADPRLSSSTYGSMQTSKHIAKSEFAKTTSISTMFAERRHLETGHW